MATVLSIMIDMVVIAVRGKGVFLKGRAFDPAIVGYFVETMSKWEFLSKAGKEEAQHDARQFLELLTQVDLNRMTWILDIIQTGLFAECASPRISKGQIAPVAPRSSDGRIEAMRKAPAQPHSHL